MLSISIEGIIQPAIDAIKELSQRVAELTDTIKEQQQSHSSPQENTEYPEGSTVVRIASIEADSHGWCWGNIVTSPGPNGTYKEIINTGRTKQSPMKAIMMALFSAVDQLEFTDGFKDHLIVQTEEEYLVSLLRSDRENIEKKYGEEIADLVDDSEIATDEFKKVTIDDTTENDKTMNKLKGILLSGLKGVEKECSQSQESE